MMVGELLAGATKKLAGATIPSPGSEARLLLSETLGVPLAWVMAHPEAMVPPDRQSLFLSWIERRTRYEPVAYLIGHREFYGIDLQVTPAVLIPRSDTELLVERALASAARLLVGLDRNLLAVDLGTGSGAVAVAMAVHQPRLRIIAVDRSTAALEVARANVSRHGVADQVDIRQSDLLRGASELPDLVVGNLPYVPSRMIDGLMPDVRSYEPRDALDGGPDGTALIRSALEQGTGLLRRPGALLFEIGEGQGAALAEAARRYYPDARVRVDRDYAGFERVLSVDLHPAS